MAKQKWGSRLGIILAVSGSALGLGNFLRFPTQAALNGGGAFMIPYFISLLLLGIPLMWIEWTLGRYGGLFDHSSAPGIFHSVWEKNRFIKYFGVIGIFGPMIIFIYYTYIESWTLGFSVFSLLGKLSALSGQEQFQGFLNSYQGLEKNSHFTSILPSYFFFLITFIANIAIVYHGIKSGIEKLCKVALPILFILATILMIRVLTLGTPDTANPTWNISNGLGFLWNPDFSALKDGKVWLAAAGQVFFTLSVGMGAILTYASYLKKNDDIVLSGLSAVSTNEFAEVILGGSIIIPAAFVFFGPTGITEIAKSGAFNISFVTMPQVFTNIMWPEFFGFIWFLLLFIAGITSSVSLAQPTIGFLEDEFNFTRERSVKIFGVITFIFCQPIIFFLNKGIIDDLDFWAGTFFITLFATVEVILFAWVFGIDKAWEHAHKGANLRIPRIYKFIIKYITPAFLFIILGTWTYQQAIPVLMMNNIAPENKPFILATRIVLVTMFILISLCVKFVWRKRNLRTYKA